MHVNVAVMEDGLGILIAELSDLKGKAFWQRLAVITKRKEFKEVEKGIYSAITSGSSDYDCLLAAARKARSFGYEVYILPNPKTVPSADLIFKNKKSYKLYELKTIQGTKSVGNRLRSSITQSDRVLLHFTGTYSPRRLADEINHHFASFAEVKEVLLFYRRQQISIRRNSVGPNLWKGLTKNMKK